MYTYYVCYSLHVFLPFVLHTLYIYEDDHKSAVFQVAYLEQFAISEAWRGSGLAQKMLREAEDLARTRRGSFSLLGENMMGFNGI